MRQPYVLGKRGASLVVFLGSLLFVASANAATKIACVGDSITQGYQLSDPGTQSYPAVLQTLLGSSYEVGNFGHGGATVLKAGDISYWQYVSESDAFQPSIVVIMLGTNDAKSNNWSHESEFESDYQAMIAHYRALGAKVFVATFPPVYASDAYAVRVNTAVLPHVRNVATVAGAPLIDVFQALSNHREYFTNSNDPVHPNKDGARAIAQTVFLALGVSDGGGLVLGGETEREAGVASSDARQPDGAGGHLAHDAEGGRTDGLSALAQAADAEPGAIPAMTSAIPPPSIEKLVDGSPSTSNSSLDPDAEQTGCACRVALKAGNHSFASVGWLWGLAVVALSARTRSRR